MKRILIAAMAAALLAAPVTASMARANDAAWQGVLGKQKRETAKRDKNQPDKERLSREDRKQRRKADKQSRKENSKKSNWVKNQNGDVFNVH